MAAALETRPSQRKVFTFDADSLGVLEEIQRDAGFQSAADTVRQAVQICGALVNQAKQGYNQVIVRNPSNDAERVLVLPWLSKVS